MASHPTLVFPGPQEQARRPHLVADSAQGRGDVPEGHLAPEAAHTVAQDGEPPALSPAPGRPGNTPPSRPHAADGAVAAAAVAAAAVVAVAGFVAVPAGIAACVCVSMCAGAPCSQGHYYAAISQLIAVQCTKSCGGGTKGKASYPINQSRRSPDQTDVQSLMLRKIHATRFAVLNFALHFAVQPAGVTCHGEDNCTGIPCRWSLSTYITCFQHHQGSEGPRTWLCCCLFGLFSMIAC